MEDLLQPTNVQPAEAHPVFIQKNISLADKNWFKTGGQARFYCEPINEEEFKAAVVFARNSNLPIFVLGTGANILISDAGFDGLVIRPTLNKFSILTKDSHFSLVTAQAGVDFGNLIDFCLKNNLVGLEEFSGIPGTVGGSVYINIHYFEFLLSHFLVKARVLDTLDATIVEVDNAWFEFGYDQSKLFDKRFYLVDATFSVRNVSDLEAAYARGRSHEMTRLRNRRYPTSNTCGSFFRNFHNDEVSLEVNGKKMIFVAYYLDKLGIKGALRCGNAIVSHQHANMFVTLPGATSTDVVQLAQTIQEMVKKEFGIVPQPECQLIGFKEWPLL